MFSKNSLNEFKVLHNFQNLSPNDFSIHYCFLTKLTDWTQDSWSSWRENLRWRFFEASWQNWTWLNLPEGWGQRGGSASNSGWTIQSIPCWIEKCKMKHFNFSRYLLKAYKTFEMIGWYVPQVKFWAVRQLQSSNDYLH